MSSLNLPSYPVKLNDNNGVRSIYDPLRKKYIVLTPEEWVRQHFINFLSQHKAYPIELMANEVLLRLNSTSKRCDTVVYDKYLTPIAIIEYKAPHIKITQEVFEQIYRYNIVLRVKYLIVSNGMQHFCCKIDYTQNTSTFLPDIPSYQDMLKDSIE
ncbi:MAG TPA: hypothetical protein DCF91_07465 [Porphyromonadaceae bacterium]|nr:hypothetical protein [Porphyromonadaceae bacterium]